MRIQKEFFHKGQNLTELALIIGVVGLVLIAMEVYVRRGFQGKVKDLTDNMIGSEQAAYEQDTSGLEVNTSTSELTSSSTMTSTELKGGERSLTGSETTTNAYNSTTEDE